VEETILMWARGGKDACEITKLLRPKNPTIKCADVRAVMAKSGFACHMCGDDEDDIIDAQTENLGQYLADQTQIITSDQSTMVETYA
jgi:hypothetical protein